MYQKALEAEFRHSTWRGGERGHTEAALDVTGGIKPMIGRRVHVPLSAGQLVEMLAFAAECDTTGETAELIATKLGGTARHPYERDPESGWKNLCLRCGSKRDHGIHVR